MSSSSILPSYVPLATADAHFRGGGGSSSLSGGGRTGLGGAPAAAGGGGGGNVPPSAHLFMGGAGRSPSVPEFLRRVGDWRQMDFESAFDQMITLLSTEPARVYASFYYRKQTRNQWARDDPAFLVVLTLFVMASALAYAVPFCHHNLWSYVWAIVYSVVVDWVLVGVLVAFVCCNVANKYLRQNLSSHTVEQDVEWLFALDVHANAFLCSFMVTHVLQYFLLPVLMSNSLVACIVSNILYTAAAIWYSYITYLGYRTLPFLGRTQQVFFWYPALGAALALIVTVVLAVLGLRVNATRVVMAFHYA